MTLLKTKPKRRHIPTEFVSKSVSKRLAVQRPVMQKTKAIRSQKLRDSARGEDCTVEFSGCRNDTATTVLAHLPSADKGGSIKSPDWWSVYSCFHCHEILDGRNKQRWTYDDFEFATIMLIGVYRTLRRMIEKGLIKIA